ncbi:MAG: hypothetical protein Ct9H300mP1_30780 [Planctomycetaceae bacterium]|nr:MAG: hypothetical protein Ct9H300mP1_30780 [Planctomycetaceae bacterium]
MSGFPRSGLCPARGPMFSALSDGTLLLGVGRSGMYRSTGEGQTWRKCRFDVTVTYGKRTFQANWGENSGPHELSDGTTVCCG